MNKMTDRKPYLLRAIYSWILDNRCTPHLVIASPGAGWVHGVPSHLLKEEILVLNISPTATEHLSIENDGIYFYTRFSGQSYKVWVAMQAIVSLVARENNEGISFPVADNLQEGPTDKDTAQSETIADKRSETDKTQKTSGHLKIIK